MFAFSGSLHVSPGERIVVTNDDSVAHTVTADGGAFDTGTVAPNGGTRTFFAPTTPGSYPFHCAFHTYMVATLVVS